MLKTIHSLPAHAPAAAFLRHAERHQIVDVKDPAAAELTAKGHADAEAFGRQIHGFDCVRLFHSPVKRCRQTAEAIARGIAATGVSSTEIVGPENALGIDYILDLKEAGRLTLLHGDHFVRLWFTGQIPANVVEAAEAIAARKVTHLVQRLQEPCAQGRRLDLHVSHDWNILILRELMVGVRHEDAGWLNFLDGVAFAPTADGLQAVYRTTTVTRPLPWSFASR
ncbi:histidine phosphatase family protein [Opitutus sp. ER46]|uniref:histidine phosphatase family protein n=1 Tax=Opitutus sp. ER46 TaxID=2161864 RepID=UPI0013047CF0|nr:histidine phosphatase family protein [Opitutus sp. ER46]